MSGTIGNDDFTDGDMKVKQLRDKIDALNSAPAPDTLENAEAVFDMLENVAGKRRHRSVLVFWGGYAAGLLCGLMAWLLLG